MGVRLHVRSLGTPDPGAEAVYEFDQERILIGRGRGADVCLPHRSVSLRHASIELSGRRYAIVDHESTNGTRMSGSLLVPGRPKPLREGDEIAIGAFSIVFRSDVPVATPTSSERTISLARRLAQGALEEEEEIARPLLAIMNGPSAGLRFVLPDPPSRVVIGRDEDCELPISDADASRRHAEVEIETDGVRVRDLGSKNGIFVGGRNVRERAVHDGDEVRVGSTVIVYEDPAGALVRALEEGEDVKFDPPAPPPSAAPAEEKEAKVDEDDAAAPVITRPPPKPKPSIAPLDLVIYVLASVIFAASLLGLVWLLRS